MVMLKYSKSLLIVGMYFYLPLVGRHFNGTITPIFSFDESMYIFMTLNVISTDWYVVAERVNNSTDVSLLKIGSDGAVRFLKKFDNVSLGNIDNGNLILFDQVVYMPLSNGTFLAYQTDSQGVTILDEVYDGNASFLLSYDVAPNHIFSCAALHDKNEIVITDYSKGKRSIIAFYNSLALMEVLLIYGRKSQSLYLLDSTGGNTGAGGIYQIYLNGSIDDLYSFSGYDGITPTDFTEGDDGLLYGTCLAGGGLAGGTLFSLNPRNGLLRSLYSFTSGNYAWPMQVVYQVPGFLYGFVLLSSTAVGALFKYDLSSSSMQFLPHTSSQIVNLIATPINDLLVGYLSGKPPFTGLFALNTTVAFDSQNLGKT